MAHPNLALLHVAQQQQQQYAQSDFGQQAGPPIRPQVRWVFVRLGILAVPPALNMGLRVWAAGGVTHRASGAVLICGVCGVLRGL